MDVYATLGVCNEIIGKVLSTANLYNKHPKVVITIIMSQILKNAISNNSKLFAFQNIIKIKCYTK